MSKTVPFQTMQFTISTQFKCKYSLIVKNIPIYAIYDSRESCSIWKSCTLPNLNSSTSDNVGSFSFIDELYSATFVKELGTPNHFFCIFTD